jgi:hypothetical protein
MRRTPLVLALITALASPATAQLSTAEVVRPILQMTAPNWIAVREWDGADLLYFTQLLPFRCGLTEILYGLNGESTSTRFNAEPCPPEEDGAVFATIQADEYLPYIRLELGSIESVTVTIIYDDGEKETHTYERAAVEIQ